MQSPYVLSLEVLTWKNPVNHRPRDLVLERPQTSATTTTCIEEFNEIILTNKVNNKKCDYLLYVGDFNFKEIDWENNNFTQM